MRYSTQKPLHRSRNNSTAARSVFATIATRGRECYDLCSERKGVVMRTSRSLLLTLLLGALVCVASTASAANSSPDACRVGTKRAVIGGKVKCLKAGQVCQARYQTAYKRYGFTCVKGHLRKRTA